MNRIIKFLQSLVLTALAMFFLVVAFVIVMFMPILVLFKPDLLTVVKK